MDDLRKWLRRQYDWPGAQYPSARQLSLAITGGKDQGTVGDIERKGITTFKRARDLSAATDTPVVQILLMAGLIQESEIETTSGELLSGRQLDAARIIGGLPDDFADAWLESGAAAIRLAGGITGTQRGAEIETREIRRGPG